MNIDAAKARSIFTSAVENHAPDQWDKFIDDACGGDDALRGRVKLLLKAHQGDDSFLDRGEDDISADQPTIDQPPLEKPGIQIGPYKLLQQIGEGGMGVVYMAEQTQPVERRVALKIIKPGMDSRQVVARFAAERQALAMMDHPNIAKVLDAGTTESGRPYFVMELVKGVPITRYCDEKRLSLRERLELMIPVCQAVQHAHQKGIIHRDIKPTNVLIAQYDGKPVPKVIDFGVAKATAQKLTVRTMFTELGQVVGTLEYMSPEQAELNQLDIDTRSDIYSLGVLLYELLTGSTPFDKQKLRTAAFHEMLRIIREDEPPKPSTRLSSHHRGTHEVGRRDEPLGSVTRSVTTTLASIAANRQTEPARLSKAVHGELDWIVMKALEKDRSRRYETANGFAADIQRYLNDEPVLACPPSITYRLTKLARRHKVAAIAGSAVTLTILISSAFSALKYFDERAARREAVEQKLVAIQNARKADDSAAHANQRKSEAERQRDAARRNLFYADMRLASVDIGLGNIGRARDSVLSHFPVQGEFDRRGWEWYYLLSQAYQAEQALYGHRSAVSDLSWSPDGSNIASVSHDGSAKVWNATTWKLVRTFDAGLTFKTCVQWSPDGKKLAWGSAGDESALRIWNCETGKVSQANAHGRSSIQAVEWSHDGRHLATCCGPPNKVRIWDPEKPESVAEFTVAERQSGGSLSWSSDDRLLAFAFPQLGFLLWNVASREKIGQQSFTAATDVAWHPSAMRLAIGNMDGECLVWDQATGLTVSTWQAHRGPVTDLKWSRDANRLVSTSHDGMVKVWDPTTGRQQSSVAGHVGRATSVAWDPECKRFASSGFDGVVRVWNANPSSQPVAIHSGLNGAMDLAWDKRGTSLFIASGSGETVHQWDPSNGKQRETISLPSIHGPLVSFRYRVGLQLHQGRLPTLQVSEPIGALDNVVSSSRSNNTHAPFLAALSRDGNQIAFTQGLTHTSTGLNGGALMIQALNGNRKILDPKIYVINGIAWSPSGRQVAAVGSGQFGDGGGPSHFGYVYVFDADMSKQVNRFRIGDTRVHATAVSWSHDGRRIAAGNEEGHCEIWEVASGRKVVSRKVHSSQVNDIAWSSDDLRIASGGNDGEVQLWDSATGEHLLSLEPHEEPITNIQWSADGRKLAAISANGLIQVWDATRGYELPRRDFWRHLIEPKEWREYAHLIEQERWSEAVELMKRLIAAEAQDHRPLYELALLYLQLDDQAGYRAACKRMLTAFSDTEVAREAYSTAWSCALRPGTLEDYDLAIALARRALDLKGNSLEYVAYYDEALGAIMLRAGRYQDALQHLQAARETKEAIPISSPARMAYLLAITHERLRHNADAQMWLDRANQEAEKELNNASNQPNWSQQLMLRLFQNEATELIGPKTDHPRPGADKGKNRNQRVRPPNPND